jgi:ADP-heptose:LPS heptosyltransferase
LGPVARATGASLAFVTREDWAPLVRRHPAVDAVLTLPPRGERGNGEVAELIREINEDIKPEIVLDWHGVGLSRYLAAQLEAYAKTRYEKFAVRRWLLAAAGIDFLPRPTRTVPEMYAAAAAKWGVKGPDRAFRLPEDEAVAERLRRDYGLSPGTVALAPGARNAAKAWPASHWRELARRLGAESKPLLLLGSGDERALCGDVAAAAPGAVNLAGDLAVEELPEALRGAALLVTNDSAFTHLAPLVDVPALVLFGPTSPRFGFGPGGPRDRIIYLNLACSPCSKHGRRPCWREWRYCLEDIEPARVAEVAAEMLRAA